MRHLLARALESELFSPEAPPEEDLMMQEMREYFPAHLIGGLGMEERADGKAEKEIEFTIYARMPDMSQLNGAKSKEHQEQWEVRVAGTDKNAGEGSMRVRKTVIEGADPVYTRATKIPYNATNDKIEVPMPSNEDEFLAFGYLAEQGMIKDRFHFPIMGTELVWEVDCFPKPDGGYHEWVKIDLEVKDREMRLPEFPVTLEDVILPKDFGKIPQEEWEKQVSELYEKYFIAKNPILVKRALAQAEQDSASIDTGEAPDDSANPVNPDPTPTAPVAQDGQDGQENTDQQGGQSKPEEGASQEPESQE